MVAHSPGVANVVTLELKDEFTCSRAECFTEPPSFATEQVYVASWASVRDDMLMWLEKSSMVILMLGREASRGASSNSQLNWRGRSPRVATHDA